MSLDRRPSRAKAERREVRISPLGLAGILKIPEQAFALVAFAHGSGSSRFSPRNMLVADALNDWGIATLLFDLLTSVEEANRANVFNISLLAERLIDAVSWADGREVVAKLPRPHFPCHNREACWHGFSANKPFEKLLLRFRRSLVTTEAVGAMANRGLERAPS